VCSPELFKDLEVAEHLVDHRSIFIDPPDDKRLACRLTRLHIRGSRSAKEPHILITRPLLVSADDSGLLSLHRRDSVKGQIAHRRFDGRDDVEVGRSVDTRDDHVACLNLSIH
jgi:hypothetical protein